MNLIILPADEDCGGWRAEATLRVETDGTISLVLVANGAAMASSLTISQSRPNSQRPPATEAIQAAAMIAVLPYR